MRLHLFALWGLSLILCISFIMHISPDEVAIAVTKDRSLGSSLHTARDTDLQKRGFSSVQWRTRDNPFLGNYSNEQYAVRPGCINLIQGGDFEQLNPAWEIQGSSRPPSYSTVQAFNTSAQSLRIGNDLALPNVDNISEVRHTSISIPADARSIILRFVYWPRYESPPGISDLQQADLFDATTDQLILPLLAVQDNAQTWKAVDYDLTSYAGREISLRFRVRNDGEPSRILMYLDNVEMEYCPATPFPFTTPTATTATAPALTATWTSTPVSPTPVSPTPVSPTPMSTSSSTTPTSIATLTPTFTPVVNLPTNTALPPVIPTADPTCPNVLGNSGFETWGSWHFGEDPVPGIYVAEPRVTGNSAVLLGNPPTQSGNVVTFSSIRQLVSIPSNAGRAELRWWKLLRTAQAGAPGRNVDRQDVILLSPSLQPIEILRRELRNESLWREDVVDLTRYRGQTLYIYFNAFNDGNGARTWMYLDDIRLLICSGAGTQPLIQPRDIATTPIAIPLTPLATGTSPTSLPPTMSPTASPLPTSTALSLPTNPAQLTNTVAIAQAAETAAATATVVPTATSNVNAIPTLPPSLLVSTETPTAVVGDAAAGDVSSGGQTLTPSGLSATRVAVATVAPPSTTRRTTPESEPPFWQNRLGPIAVLLGILVLIGFIVFAVIQTFQNSRVP